MQIVIHPPEQRDQVLWFFRENTILYPWQEGGPLVCLDGFEGTVYLFNVPYECLKCVNKAKVNIHGIVFTRFI